MRDIERYGGGKTRHGARPREWLNKTDNVVGVDHNAVQQTETKP